MIRYRKGVIAVVGGVLAGIAAIWGEKLSLPPTWPETTLAVITPLLVVLIPNRG